MEYLIFLGCRVCIRLVTALPILAVFRLGQGLGLAGYYLLGSYRRLVMDNMTAAYAREKSRPEIRALARQHFARLGANLLSSLKVPTLGQAELHERVSVVNIEVLREAFDRGRGVVLVLSHLGNWELFAQICNFLPGRRWGTVYMPLGNRYIEAYVQGLRTARGVRLFSRKDGFGAPLAFLREGGAVGVLVDQFAGEGGVWTPFFRRLASTSPLAALFAARTGAVLVPLAVQTCGPARWKVVVSPPLEALTGQDAESAVNAQTARISQVVEQQVRAAPADWFWVHRRWKPPEPAFLNIGQRRGIALPPGMEMDDLRPFRILVRSTNWPGDLAMTIPVVDSMARKRPDARVCVLTPARFADAWRAAHGVAEVIVVTPGQGVFGAAAAIRRAGKFDAGIVLPNSLRSALEMFAAGVPLRVGYAGRWRRWFLHLVIDEPTGGGEESATFGLRIQQSLRYVRLARRIGANAPPPGTAMQREVTLMTAVQREWIGARFVGNGRDELTLELVNRHDAPLRVWAASGIRFETADPQSRMALARSGAVELAPGEKTRWRCPAVTTTSATAPGEQEYLLRGDTLPALNHLLERAEVLPHLSHAAVQTAVLILTEDAPLEWFARFALPPCGGNASDATGPAMYQVETVEIIAAFGLLKKAGHRKAEFAATRDSRLRIEAMMDPRAHAAALKYYDLAGAREWQYWCEELERGKRATRHRALRGIGRYYPDAALQWLPDWVRAKYVGRLYRLAAIQALAETRRPEAIRLLRGFLREFDGVVELREAIREAIGQLEREGVFAVETGEAALELRSTQAES